MAQFISGGNNKYFQRLFYSLLFFFKGFRHQTLDARYEHRITNIKVPQRRRMLHRNANLVEGACPSFRDRARNINLHQQLVPTIILPLVHHITNGGSMRTIKSIVHSINNASIKSCRTFHFVMQNNLLVSPDKKL